MKVSFSLYLNRLLDRTRQGGNLRFLCLNLSIYIRNGINTQEVFNGQIPYDIPLNLLAYPPDIAIGIANVGIELIDLAAPTAPPERL